jgi:hypothetical protein
VAAVILAASDGGILPQVSRLEAGRLFTGRRDAPPLPISGKPLKIKRERRHECAFAREFGGEVERIQAVVLIEQI